MRALACVYFSPVVLVILQIALSAVLGSYVFYRLYDKVNKKWIVWLSFLGYITSVPIGLYNVTLWKDIFFSQIIVFWAILLFFYIKDKKEIASPYILSLLGVLLFLTSSIRHNGVILLVFVPLFFYLGKVIKIKKVFILLGVASVLYILSLTLVPRYLGVNMKTSVGELSKIQIISSVLSSNHVVYNETKHPPLSTIDRFIPREEIKTRYICQTVDSILASKKIDSGVFDQRGFRGDFNQIFFYLSLNNFPQVVGDRACIASNAFLGSDGSKYYNALDYSSPYPEYPNNLGLKLNTEFSQLHNLLLRTVNFTAKFPFNLFFRALFIPLVVYVIALFYYKKDKALFFYSLMVMCQVPFLLLFLPASDFRYFYFLHFGFFFIIPMFFIESKKRKAE